MTVREMYVDAGLTLRQIEEITGTPYSTIRDRLSREGVDLRPKGGARGRLKHDEYIKTAFMYERLGLSVTEIAEILGLAHDSVCNRLRRHGVEMRSRGESTRLRFKRVPKARSSQS